MNSNEKKEIIDEIKEKLENTQSVILAEYLGITAVDISLLRKKARNEGVYLRVFKNSLAKYAFQGTNFESLRDHMKGPLIYGLSEDPLAASKVLYDFSKKNEKIVIKTGFYNGDVIDVNQIKVLASIPSRDELLAKLLGVIQSPVSSLARLLGALSKKKEEIVE